MRAFVSRLAFSAFALLLVSAVLLLLTRAVPDSPARVVLGHEATEAQVRQFEQEAGLDRPLLEQYGRWLGDLVLRGDFGKSWVTGRRMNEELARTLPITLELVTVAFLFAVALSLPLGIVSALYQGRWIDHAARLFAVIGVSIPGFWLGLMLIAWFAVGLGWLPPGGWVPLSAGLWPHLQSLLLPAFALGIYYTAILSRMTRSSMVEVLSQDYIRTARAMGLAGPRVLAYAIKNALAPVVSVGAMSFGYMFGWALIVEQVFNIAGLSRALLTAITQRDFYMVQAVVFVFTLVFILANLLADLLNRYLNPKLARAG